MFDPTQPLPAGKLPLPFLEKLLTRFAPHDPRIVVGPRAGEDAAVFDLGDRYLVAKTDPITFATSEIGWYAVNVNANDVAVMGARPGDRVLLVKSAPIEGTALIALECAETLRQRGYDEDFICRCQRFLHEPGISVVAPALLAAAAPGVHAMHDPTEGGVMTGLLEMARGARVGMTIDLDAIPIAAEGAALCREFGLDPLGTIASGAVLAAVAEDGANTLIGTLLRAGYPATVIGRVTDADAGLVARRGGQPVEWPMFATDEITKIFV